MKLSIIVPIYNVEMYLKKCLDSLILQEEEKCEIILIDDGSTDSSMEICKEYEKKYSNIKFYHKENGGLSDARNYGIERANGEYLWFIDSDDYIKAEAISNIIKIIENEPTDVIVIKSQIFDENNNYYDECLYSIVEGIYKSKEYLGELKKNPKGVIFCAQYHICKKELIKKNKLYFYKGIIHEDELWTPQLLISADDIYYSNLNIYFHYMRSDSIMHSSKIEKSGKCDLFVAEELLKIFEASNMIEIEYLFDRVINIYFQAVWKVPNLINANLKKRIYLLKKSYYFKTKMKSLLFLVSPKLYLLIHSKKEG